MYAIIVTGGKQYRVQQGDVIYVEKLDAEENAEVVFDKVIAVKINDAGSFPCTMAEVKSPDGGERNMRFFPNSLAKIVLPVDDQGRRMPKVKTTGTVATWYAGQDTIDAAMAGLAGKTIKVVGKETYSYRDYNTKEIRQTSVFAYEWK